jgi:predicted 3-demethylubiquinone-9 3-methyltransferase (glyoxalase superfamily)
MISRNTICLWYDGTALDAAQFYAQTFPDSAVGAILRAPGDYASGKQGDVLTVEFTVSWQITPRALTDAIADPDRAAAKRAFEVMMQMRKIDIAAIEAARRG